MNQQIIVTKIHDDYFNKFFFFNFFSLNVFITRYLFSGKKIYFGYSSILNIYVCDGGGACGDVDDDDDYNNDDDDDLDDDVDQNKYMNH